MPGATRIGIFKDSGFMVADATRLFVAKESHCAVIRSSDGTTEATWKVPFRDRDWGYLASVGTTLVGSATQRGGSRRTVEREAILEGAYTDDRPIVCSDGVFAVDKVSAEPLWQYQSSGAILNPTISCNDTAVVFIENETSSFDAASHGRIPAASLLRANASLVCVALDTGEVTWRTPFGRDQIQNIYVICTTDLILIVNSRNEQTVRYDVHCFEAKHGTELWAATQDTKLKTGGDHGEQDKHPVLVGNTLIVEPLAYDVTTGKQMPDLNLGGRGYGCGTLSASSRAIFFRSQHPASYQLATRQIELITNVTRPGCWINMIPASGLLLIPEGSAGCTCNFPIQSSIALTPEMVD
jgi:hypothetical protein